MGSQIEGYYEVNQKVIIIEDLVSTGKSSLEVMEVLRKSGLDVRGMVSIFTYEFKIATDQFTQAGIDYHSPNDYESLISVAIDKGIITPDEQNTLLNWRLDPAIWQGSSKLADN